jgi:uncharacterized protein (TIGR01777 family)
MRMAITGSTGMVGTLITEKWKEHGHEVTRIVRNHSPKTAEPTIWWDPVKQEMDAAEMEGHDVVIHLAGENIAAGRWTKQQREKILNSRVQGTALLSQTLARLKQPPKVLLSASAIGYYGNHAANVTLDENSDRGNDFLSNVVLEWEKATRPAQEEGIRVVQMRFGIILSLTGGAIAKMLLPFRLGVGGKIGHGQQMMSWIALDEIPYIVEHLIVNESISGPVNVVSENPVSNEVFTRLLGEVLHRPTVFPMPTFALRLLFGEMADALLIGGSKVIPGKLQQSGYSYVYPDLIGALLHIFKK